MLTCKHPHNLLGMRAKHITQPFAHHIMNHFQQNVKSLFFFFAQTAALSKQDESVTVYQV
jgi:hypothetical protein